MCLIIRCWDSITTTQHYLLRLFSVFYIPLWGVIVIQLLAASWNHFSTKVSNKHSVYPPESLNVTDAVMYITKCAMHRFPSFLPEELQSQKLHLSPSMILKKMRRYFQERYFQPFCLYIACIFFTFLGIGPLGNIYFNSDMFEYAWQTIIHY